ncbi:MAG: hypothetical protein AB7F08_13710 [Dongiaceae bacterium]
MSGRRYGAAQRLLSNARNAGRRAERAYGPAGSGAAPVVTATATPAKKPMAVLATDIADRVGKPERI